MAQRKQMEYWQREMRGRGRVLLRWERLSGANGQGSGDAEDPERRGLRRKRGCANPLCRNLTQSFHQP